jgi:hypothetical protein
VPKQHDMKVIVKFHAFLTLTLHGDEWSHSCCGHFTTRENVSSAHMLGGCMDNRNGLDVVVKKKFFLC